MTARGPHMRLRHKRQFHRVVNESHPLFDRIVEFSGVGRGVTVYGICDGVEHEFVRADLVMLSEEVTG